MFSNPRGMAICIGVTGVASILLWFYFKTRIESVEGKLDNMFNMIQSFSEQAPTLPKDNSPYLNEQEMAEAPYENQVVSQQLSTEMFEEVVENIVNNNTKLIDVSDDSGEDSESDDESDAESEEEEEEEEDEEVMLEVETPKPTEEIALVEEKKLFQTEDSLDDIDTDESDDESDAENDKKNLELKEEVKEYSDMKVSDLKKLASDKGLTGYAKLNKAGLVNLLENN